MGLKINILIYYILIKIDKVNFLALLIEFIGLIRYI